MYLLIIHSTINASMCVRKLRQVIHAYLNDRIQVTKVNLIDLYLAEHYKSDFSNYADDTTPYNCGSTFSETISDLEITLDNLFNWFCYNDFRANASKCHFFLSPLNAKSINIKTSVTEGSCSENFLGNTIDSILLKSI